MSINTLGVGIEPVLAGVPVGNLVSRVLRTDTFKFPQFLETVVLVIFRLIETAWIGKRYMKETGKLFNKRKRKNALFLDSSENTEITASKALN